MKGFGLCLIAAAIGTAAIHPQAGQWLEAYKNKAIGLMHKTIAPAVECPSRAPLPFPCSVDVNGKEIRLDLSRMRIGVPAVFFKAIEPEICIQIAAMLKAGMPLGWDLVLRKDGVEFARCDIGML